MEKGILKKTPLDESGFNTPGDIHGIVQRTSDGQIDFFVTNNDAQLQHFTKKINNKRTLVLKSNAIYALVQLVNGKTYRQEFFPRYYY